MLRIDRRIQAIIDNIPRDSRIIDIGSDHGKVPVYAVLNGIAQYAIATDISRKSLEKTVALAKEHNVADKIECRVGNGLEVIKEGEGDTLIIAGMGAREITEILLKSKLKFDTYILVPHNATVRLRHFLINNEYYIKKDHKVAANDRFYDIIVCMKGFTKLSERELMLGKSDKDNADFRAFLIKEREKLAGILKAVNSNSDDYNNLKKYYDLIDEVINEN
ncbi:MAG: tRNA (adenine(22)-N(1))-methyltransferase [Christensenellales bacterium]|jgi:tRNA (adenine22-N1)-methyltransferase